MTDATLRSRIDALAALDTDLHDDDFPLTWQQSDAAIRLIVLAAEVLDELMNLSDAHEGIAAFLAKRAPGQ